MRRALALLVVVTAAPALAGPGAAPPAHEAPPPRIKSAADLEQRIVGDAERLDRLLERAREDPRMAKVERYMSWSTPAEFQNPKRDVHVGDLIDILADEDAPMDLREKARDALKSITPRSQDPDLEISSGHSRRAAFSIGRVVPLLGAKSPKGGSGGDQTRAFAAEILDSYWHYTHKAIQLYNPRDPSTWKPAMDEWRRFLAGK